MVVGRRFRAVAGVFVDRVTPDASSVEWARTLRVPGRVIRSWSDSDNELTVVSYETSGGADAVRAMWLDTGLTFDIGQHDGSAMSVLAVGDGMVVVSHGCSRAVDPERARSSPVTSFDVIDLRTGSVVWSCPVTTEPFVTVIAGVVWQSWSMTRSVTLEPVPPDVFRRITDGAIVDGTEPVLAARIAAERAARWERDEARPRLHRLVDGQAGYDDWALRVIDLTEQLPVVRLIAVRSGDWEAIEYFAEPDADGRERLVIARHGEVCLQRRPRSDRDTTVHLVGGAWDLSGMWWNGRWLAAPMGPDVVEYFRLG